MTDAFLDFLEPFILSLSQSQIRDVQSKNGEHEGEGKGCPDNAHKNQRDNVAVYRQHAETLTLLLMRVLDRPLSYVDLSAVTDQGVSETEAAASEKNTDTVAASKMSCHESAQRCVHLMGRIQPDVVTIIDGLREKHETRQLRKKNRCVVFIWFGINFL